MSWNELAKDMTIIIPNREIEVVCPQSNVDYARHEMNCFGV